MDRSGFVALLLVIMVMKLRSSASAADVAFASSYAVYWGEDHVAVLDRGTRARISLDSRSGCGFESKQSYLSGFFHMRIKLQGTNTAGVITTIYMTSNGRNHDELDMEFLGNVEGKPVTLQTNVFADGQGDREQRIDLWFDPKADFHSYKFLWNQHQAVFYVDDVPIRVFKNNTSLGVPFPLHPMKVTASIWDGSDWATDGGQTKVNWSYAPFIAEYRDFRIVGCPVEKGGTGGCYGAEYWWNQPKYWKLGKAEKKKYKTVKEKYTTYDYCNDRTRHAAPPPECASNS